MSAVVFRASWILPIDQPPIRDGWVSVEAGRITAVGRGRASSAARDLGDVALMPGLVNAHTHLELSWLEGRVPRAASMVRWVRSLMTERRTADASGAEAAARRAVETARAAGTVLIGDVANGWTTPALLHAAGIGGVVFHELIGFRAADPDAMVRAAWTEAGARARTPEVDISVSAHAPYSVSPALFTSIAHARRRAPLTVHLGESPEEVEFLRTGHGPFRSLLEDLGAWNPAWPVPRCDPAAYLDRLGYLAPGCLAVHGVHLQDEALVLVRDRGCVLVTCPRSNEWVGAGAPPIRRFYDAGLRIAVGTDSLASTASLNLFDELAALRRMAPEVPARRFLDSATRIGADALGAGALFGSITPGKRAALVAIDIPAGRIDVEEYLVSGVPSDSVHPLS